MPGDDEPCLGLQELKAHAKNGKTLQDVIVYLEAIQNFDKNYPALEIVE